VTLDNNSELDNWQLNPSLTEEYMSATATYTLPSASAVANDNLSFVVFAKTNSGKFTYGAGASNSSFNLILKDEAGLVAVDSTTYKIAVDDLKVAGYNGSFTASDEGIYVNNPSNVALKLSATSTLSPLDSYAIACENSGGFFSNANNYVEPSDWDGLYTVNDYEITIDLSNSSDIFGGGCDDEGSQTIFVSVKTEGGNTSSSVQVNFVLDTVAPVIQTFMLHEADNASQTASVDSNVIGFTILHFDENKVAYYLVSESDISSTISDNTNYAASGDGLGNTSWTAVENPDSTTGTYTFASEPVSNSRILYAWVNDLAGNITQAASDSIGFSSE